MNVYDAKYSFKATYAVWVKSLQTQESVPRGQVFPVHVTQAQAIWRAHAELEN